MIVIDEHCGTHFDAPPHFIPPPAYDLPFGGPLGDETGDRVPTEELMEPAVVVDVSFLAGEGEPEVSLFIEPDHVEAWAGSTASCAPERSCSSAPTATATT